MVLTGADSIRTVAVWLLRIICRLLRAGIDSDVWCE